MKILGTTATRREAAPRRATDHRWHGYELLACPQVLGRETTGDDRRLCERTTPESSKLETKNGNLRPERGPNYQLLFFPTPNPVRMNDGKNFDCSHNLIENKGPEFSFAEPPINWQKTLGLSEIPIMFVKLKGIIAENGGQRHEASPRDLLYRASNLYPVFQTS